MACAWTGMRVVDHQERRNGDEQREAENHSVAEQSSRGMPDTCQRN